MRLSLAYEMQRPVVDDHAVIEDFLMATETVHHDRVMSSIEMFGQHVIPELKRTAAERARRGRSAHA